MVIYDLIIEAQHGSVQETYNLARSLAHFTGHSVTVKGNGVAVEVRPGMTDAECADAYMAAMGLVAS